ncbi:pyrroline-5-carboxylate reductase [Synechococcus sp. PCC 7335]|nr:pyrroline-5-carboxylate reductase [Synechococcus sp. PCC 7335]
MRAVFLSVRLGIIGGGVMGEALLSRLLGQGLYTAEEVVLSEPSPERRQVLFEQHSIKTTDNNREVLEASNVVLLAIKPQVFDIVSKDFQGVRCEIPPLVLSILAGVPLSKLESAMPGWPVVRAMPNTPATVGRGMTAIALGTRTLTEHGDLAQKIFAAMGQVVKVPEAMLDAVTGLSGSGPGYVAIVIEALADGGVAAGLPRAIANQLALQTVLGTAELIQKTGMHPAELKDRVTSPGGTTIAGIACLEELGLRSALIEAVRTASSRSRELGKPANGKPLS